MNFEELLKKFLSDEKQVDDLLAQMKENKIYISSEENIDVRYGKLKDEHNTLVTKEQEAQTLIKQLQESTKGNEDLQSKITEYETKIADLEAKNTEMAIDNAIKFKLLDSGAKASDIDYLMFKLKQQKDDFKLDDKGEVKGLEDDIEGLKKNYSGQFEADKKKKVEVIDLPNEPNPNEPTEPKTLAEAIKMKYEENKGE